MKFEPGAKVGQYQVLGELGRGGMATVYRAYQPSLEREVALKILPDFLVEQPGFKARFHREAVAVARLQHPNILSVFDHGEQDGVTYIVSEYVEGGTLAQRMGAPIQLDYCVRILRPIADALDYAHSEGIIHRDVKPSNILIDRRGVPILSDFGLARLAEAVESEKLTQTGAMVGTPTYMAPEQCAGEEAGAPADIYALAVIAFEMVTGRVPFSAPTPLGVIAAHQVTPPPSPRKFNPSLPQVVEQPLLAGLEKQPAKRPETATDFVEGLAAAVTSSSTQYPLTPPPSTQLPATPTAVYTPAPPPSYTAPPVTPSPVAPAPEPSPAPAPAPALTPAPVAPPSYPPQPYAAQSSPPPYAAQAYAPVATPPPPSYPSAQQSPPPYATPAPAYATPQPWMQPAAAQPGAARVGAPIWMTLALWGGVALGVIALIVAVIYDLFGTDLADSDRWTWLLIGLLAALATTVSLAAVFGLGARDRWGPAMGWTSVAALALTIIGAPLAAAVGWGLAQAPRGQLVADPPSAGGGMRLGGSAAVGVLLLMVMGGASTWGWTHPFTPSTNPAGNQTLTACNIVQPDAAIDSSTVGSSCGFSLGAPVVQLDCKGVTAPPAPIKAKTHNDDSGDYGGNATLSMDSAGCHLTSPTYHVDSRLESTANLEKGDTILIADFLPPQAGAYSDGFLYTCDDTGCIDVFLYMPDSDIYVYDDSNQLLQQHVSTRIGTNRLVVAAQGQKLRIWFNGDLIGTETVGRTHDAGTYAFYMESADKTQTVSTDLLKMSVYRLT